MDVAEVLETEAEKSGGNVDIYIGLNIPDDVWGTTIHIKSGNINEIASGLALFASNADKIERAVKSAVESGEGPDWARIGVKEDGGLIVEWGRIMDGERRELTVR